jgi:hypothetical protein
MSAPTFTQALKQAAAQARRTLDPELAERLSDALSLVKDGHVFQTEDGTWQVNSATREGLVYSVNGVCGCEDAHFQAPQGLCKHRLAMFLSRRTMQLMQQPAVPVVPERLPEPWPDNDLEDAPQSPPVETEPAPAPLPEAPASVNVRVQIDGREVQWTLRDRDEARLAGRLEALLARYPLPQPTPQASSTAEGWCRKHGLQMMQTTKDGRSWWSHKTAEDQWCKGK